MFSTLPAQTEKMIRDDLAHEASEAPVGRGVWLVLPDRRVLLDGVSGTFNLPLGYDHPSVLQAIIDQVNAAAHVSSYFSAPYADEVVATLASLAPGRIAAGWMRDLTGSTANECAVKIAMKATGLHEVLSLFLSLHGQTLFTTAISGDSARGQAFSAASPPGSMKVPAPYCFRCPYGAEYPSCGLLCVEKIEDSVKHASGGQVACMIVEPVLGNGGNIVPPPQYFPALQGLCRDLDILLIVDEVQTGMGRTGHLFGSETFGIEPNILTLAKGLSGIGLPAAAVLMEPELDVLERWEHSFTCGGNLPMLAAIKATLNVVLQDGFLEAVRSRGQRLERSLRALQERYRCVGDVRGVGMMWGLEIVEVSGAPDPDKARRIVRRAEDHYGLLLRTSSHGDGPVIKLRPALIASEAELDEMVDRLSQSFADVEEGVD